MDSNRFDGETEQLATDFEAHMTSRLQSWMNANPGKKSSEAPWYEIVRNSLFAVFKWHVMLVVLIRTLCDIFALAYAYFIYLLIAYLYDD